MTNQKLKGLEKAVDKKLEKEKKLMESIENRMKNTIKE